MNDCQCHMETLKKNLMVESEMLQDLFADKKIMLKWVDTTKTINGLGHCISTDGVHATAELSTGFEKDCGKCTNHRGLFQNVAETLRVTFIPFEGLLQSSGWTTSAAAFYKAQTGGDGMIDKT